MAYSRFKADHRVRIYRAANGYAEEDISPDVVSIYTSKTYGHAAGGFTIFTTFNQRYQDKRYDELLKPDDVIFIELDGGEGNGLESVMIGLVTRASRTMRYDQEGKPVYRCKISGMDFGKLLIKHNCIADTEPLIGQIGSRDIVRVAKGVQFSGTPGEIVKSAFEKLFLDQVPWASQYFQWSPAANQDNWETFDYPILESTGSIWTAMKSMANEPYNCLNTETYGKKLHIVLEPYPFHAETGKLTRANFISIPDSHIEFEDLGISDDERVNYLYFRADAVVLFGNDSEGSPLQYELLINYDKNSVLVHGFRPHYPKSNFGPPGYKRETNAKPDQLTAAHNRALEFWNRFKNNHALESGAIGVKGNPSIKCGGGIVTEGNNMEYLAETVAHNYEWGVKYGTTLQVTRGQGHGR